MTTEPQRNTPLTADDVKLLRKGDWLAHITGGPCRLSYATKKEICVVYDRAEWAYTRTTFGTLRFLGRPDQSGWMRGVGPSDMEVERKATDKGIFWRPHVPAPAGETYAAHEAAPALPAAEAECENCDGEGSIEYEGGDGEGWPSKPERDTCLKCRGTGLTPPPAAEAVAQEFPYTRTFNAIADAITVNWPGRKGSVGISVEAFQRSFNAGARPAPDASAVRLVDQLVQELLPNQGDGASVAFGLALRLQAALSSEPVGRG